MSRTRHTHAETQMIAFVCARCKAAPQQWCKTSAGHWYTMLHAERYYAWKAVQAREARLSLGRLNGEEAR